MGFLKPINFTAASFIMKADESEVNSLEKSLPCIIFHPIVFP